MNWKTHPLHPVITITFIPASFLTTTRRRSRQTEAVADAAERTWASWWGGGGSSPSPSPSPISSPSKERSFWTASRRAVSFVLCRLTSGRIHREPRSAWVWGGLLMRALRPNSPSRFYTLAGRRGRNRRRDDYMARCKKLTLFKKKRCYYAALANVHTAVWYQWGKSATWLKWSFSLGAWGGFCRCQSSQFPLRIFFFNFSLKDRAFFFYYFEAAECLRWSFLRTSSPIELSREHQSVRTAPFVFCGSNRTAKA